MTKSDLEQLTLLNSEISRDLERLQELYALLTGCTSSIRGLPHIGLLRGSDRTDKFVSMIDVLEQQIKERVLDSAALYIQIWSYINTIHDPLVRQIISSTSQAAARSSPALRKFDAKFRAIPCRKCVQGA